MGLPVVIVHVEEVETCLYFCDITGEPPQLEVHSIATLKTKDYYLVAGGLRLAFVLMVLRWNPTTMAFEYEQISGPPIDSSWSGRAKAYYAEHFK